MPSTFLSLHYHIVFSTKHRKPDLRAEWCARLYAYVSGTAKGLGAGDLTIGGVPDHVHLLVSLRATHTLAAFVRETKKASSVWIHKTIGLPDFAWQEGYAAFTVSASVLPDVRRYIETQEEHHRQRDFPNELRTLLSKSGVNFEERYLM